MPEQEDVDIHPAEFHPAEFFNRKTSFLESSSSFTLDLAFPLLFVLHDFFVLFAALYCKKVCCCHAGQILELIYGQIKALY